jgi:hypothetical protein
MIEIWLPHEAHTGERSRMWMKLQNEVQMAWFQHPVNEAREARGLPAVNSIWFHAQGTLKPVGKPFGRVLSASPAALALRAPRRPRPAPCRARLRRAARRGRCDARRAAVAVRAVHRTGLGTLARRARRARARLVRTVARRAAERRAGRRRIHVVRRHEPCHAARTRGDLRKFWRRRALASLFE